METKKNMPENKFIKSSDMDRKTYRKLLHATKKGEVVRLRRGIYATEDALANTMIDIEKIVPGGILCLYSAWNFYGMTTQIPSAYYIAINRNRKVVIPDFPDIQLIYQNANILSIGCTETQIQDFKFSIYDKERCVCDAIKYRNKIGIDVMAEVLSSYLKASGRNIEREFGIRIAQKRQSQWDTISFHLSRQFCAPEFTPTLNASLTKEELIPI